MEALKQGEKFNKLTVLGFSKKNKYGHKIYFCQCECGRITEVRDSKLINEKTKTCGKGDCKKKIGRGTRLYKTWESMKSRCDCKSNTAYGYYGGRGISYCTEWTIFENFMNWAMESGYRDDLTIDRINSDGNYTPENCRWVDRKTQQRNRRCSVMIAIDGETKNLIDWADLFGLNHNTVAGRYYKGVRGKELFKEPQYVAKWHKQK